MTDYLNDKYVNDMFWPSFHPGRPADHWSRQNEKEWTPESILEFLKEEMGGEDPFTVMGSRVLVKRPYAPPTTRGGIIIPQDSREDASRELTIAKVLDWGPDAFRYKRIFPSGTTCNRGDWISFKVYEHTRLDIEPSSGRKYDFELLYVYDDKIIGSAKEFHDFFAPKR